MNERNFTDATFNAALVRARAREAAEIQAAIAGKQKQTFCPIKIIDNSIKNNMG